jgi:antitoxin component YwqK of YwqJK toxin-antitoxin module
MLMIGESRCKTVYKSARNCLIKMTLFPLAMTNEMRMNVVDWKYAAYRTNIAHVDEITNKYNYQSYDSVSSDFDENFIYKIDKKVYCHDYDISSEHSSRGIHYFLSRNVAYFFNFDISNFSGNYKNWYPNGQLMEEGRWLIGKREDHHYKYSENGQLIEKSSWKEGVRNGLTINWDIDGNTIEESSWKNGDLFEKKKE